MSSSVILDTSVLIAVERGQLQLENVISPDENYLLPTVALAEFQAGIEGVKNPKYKELALRDIEIWKSHCIVKRFGEAEANEFAKLSAASKHTGKTRTQFDLAIAAHALVENAIILTRDSRAAFHELPGVQVRIL